MMPKWWKMSTQMLCKITEHTATFGPFCLQRLIKTMWKKKHFAKWVWKRKRAWRQETSYSWALIPDGLRVRNLAIQKLSRRRMTERSCLWIFSMGRSEISFTLCWPELKWVTYGRLFPPFSFWFLISDLVLLNLVYSEVSVFPTYCFEQRLQVIKYMSQLVLQERLDEIGKLSPVTELVNLVLLWIKVQTIHFLGHLKAPGGSSLVIYGLTFAWTRRSRRFGGRRKEVRGGSGKICLSFWELWRRGRCLRRMVPMLFRSGE